MRRREFIALLGGGVSLWPLAALAQQPAMPVVGFLGITSAASQPYLTAFRQGLSETDYVEGHNVSIEYRWGEDQYNRFPDLAADLIRHHVNVIVTLFTTSGALAAKAATSTIPIVFSIGDDGGMDEYLPDDETPEAASALLKREIVTWGRQVQCAAHYSAYRRSAAAYWPAPAACARNRYRASCNRVRPSSAGWVIRRTVSCR